MTEKFQIKFKIQRYMTFFKSHLLQHCSNSPTHCAVQRWPNAILYDCKKINSFYFYFFGAINMCLLLKMCGIAADFTLYDKFRCIFVHFLLCLECHQKACLGNNFLIQSTTKNPFSKSYLTGLVKNVDIVIYKAI